MRPDTRRIKLLLFALTVGLAIWVNLSERRATAFSAGPPPSHTGAPGEALCTACHTTFEVNTGPGFVRLDGLPAVVSPGQEVPLSLTVRSEDGFLYGFQLTALDPTGARAGTFVVTDDVNTQTADSVVAGQPRQYLQHTFRGAFPVEFNQRTWNFTWVAPTTNAGTVTFYAAGNGAYGYGETSGDYIYTAQADACFLGMSAPDASFAARGGVGSVAARGGACAQDVVVTSEANWISVIAVYPTSQGTQIDYAVGGNPNPTRRVGVIRIAGLTYTVYQGARFADVPKSHPQYREIGKLSARGIIEGCGGGRFCPDALTGRQQAVTLILRSLGVFDPLPPALQRDTDVPPTNPFYTYIEEAARRGITNGCAPNLFCPDDPTTRGQMAALILRALGEFNPPAPPGQRYADVPPGHPFYHFIERLAALGIAGECAPDLFCPDAPLTRAATAALLVRAFGL